MEHIMLPTKILFEETGESNIGKTVITPCHQGYGTTLGNALRRVLLSSLPGAAVESVKIKGVQHEFSGITGVQEDMIEIILNLKQLAVRLFSDEPVTLTLQKKGVGSVTAGDFKKDASVEIMNPGLHIATITDKQADFEMEIIVGKGRGYVPVSEKQTRQLDLGTIAIDSLYTPIRDVGYTVEMTRLGDVTDYEKLTMTIETNGTVTPKEAISQATKILMDHFALILDAAGGELNEDIPENVSTEEETAIALHSDELGSDIAGEEEKPEETKKKKPAKAKKKK